MLRIPEEGHWFSFERIFFPDPDDFNSSHTDVARFLRCKSRHEVFKNEIEDIDFTLVTNLRQTPAEIFDRFAQTVRYEIKRALAEHIDIYFFTHQELKSDSSLIEDFKSTFLNYCDYSNKQSLKTVYDDKKVQSYIDHQCILLSIASYHYGKVYHLYVFDDKDSLLVHSASEYMKEDSNRGFAGRANKLLHFKDMLYFQEKGIELYDWGGVASFENPNGIDKFKMSFGGERRILYSYFVGNSLLGKSLVWAKKLYNG